MAGLNDLGLSDEQMPEQTYDDLPEFGGFAPPPQPGAYRFALPQNLQTVFELIDHKDKGQRLKVVFDNSAPLRIWPVGAVVGAGDTYTTQLTNVERKRGKDGPEASDFDYLLKALKETARPKSNKAYGETLLKHASEQFGGDIRWSWFCNDTKDIWVNFEQPDHSSKLQKVEGTKGCGRKYYQADHTNKDEQKIQKQADGTYPLQVQCVCGGVVRAFSNIDNYRS